MTKRFLWILVMVLWCNVGFAEKIIGVCLIKVDGGTYYVYKIRPYSKGHECAQSKLIEKNRYPSQYEKLNDFYKYSTREQLDLISPPNKYITRKELYPLVKGTFIYYQLKTDDEKTAKFFADMKKEQTQTQQVARTSESKTNNIKATIIKDLIIKEFIEHHDIYYVKIFGNDQTGAYFWGVAPLKIEQGKNKEYEGKITFDDGNECQIKIFATNFAEYGPSWDSASYRIDCASSTVSDYFERVHPNNLYKNRKKTILNSKGPFDIYIHKLYSDELINVINRFFDSKQTQIAKKEPTQIEEVVKKEPTQIEEVVKKEPAPKTGRYGRKKNTIRIASLKREIEKEGVVPFNRESLVDESEYDLLIEQQYKFVKQEKKYSQKISIEPKNYVNQWALVKDGSLKMKNLVNVY